MPDIKKILVATDFSNVAEKLKEHATLLCRLYEAELDVIHVFDPSVLDVPAPYNFLPGVGGWVRDNMNEIQERGMKTLESYAASFAGKASAHFLEGRPEKEIVRYAERNQVDMIVLGRHGHRGIGSILLGSVAKYVVSHANCHVLTVIHREKVKADGTKGK